MLCIIRFHSGGNLRYLWHLSAYLGKAWSLMALYKILAGGRRLKFCVGTFGTNWRPKRYGRGCRLKLMVKKTHPNFYMIPTWLKIPHVSCLCKNLVVTSISDSTCFLESFFHMFPKLNFPHVSWIFFQHLSDFDSTCFLPHVSTIWQSIWLENCPLFRGVHFFLA